MLDPRMLADRREEIAESCRRRGLQVDLDAAIAARERVASLQTELQEWNRQRKEHQASGKRKLSPEEREAHNAEGRRIKDEASAVESRLAEAEAELRECMLDIPNLVHPDVPVGGEEDFRELRRVGKAQELDFEPKDHLTLAESLDLVDFDAGTRVTGQKFYFLKREAAFLELALQRFALDIAVEAGFVPHVTPDLARRQMVDAMAFNPRGEETQIYSIADSELDLIGTAEITLGGIHADSLLEESELPIRLAGLSHCFRTEAGAHGRESRGLYRVHQFTKVELFAFTRPEDSEAMHEEMLRIEERIFSDLEIPYRVIDVASGDLGAPAYRKYDIEAWMPGRGEGGLYGEVTSTSNCTNFQARRLKTRFRRTDKKGGELVHTLNGTALANSRALVALLENHQQADGGIAIPKALRPYTGFDRIGPR
ncbi:MAG: serine--tRNA ligase [Myxococcota bacterium]